MHIRFPGARVSCKLLLYHLHIGMYPKPSHMLRGCANVISQCHHQNPKVCVAMLHAPTLQGLSGGAIGQFTEPVGTKHMQ